MCLNRYSSCETRHLTGVNRCAIDGCMIDRCMIERCMINRGRAALQRRVKNLE
jgi:hypothetical protein